MRKGEKELRERSGVVGLRWGERRGREGTIKGCQTTPEKHSLARHGDADKWCSPNMRGFNRSAKRFNINIINPEMIKLHSCI